MDYTKVYNPGGTLLGILQNASIQYTLKDAPLHTAKITLPISDPGNDLCQMGNEVEIFDNGTRVELFRIIGSPEAVYTAQGGTITYSCEHALAYLMDDVLFQYHEIGGWQYGGSNENTAACISYILSHQTVARWQLGTCAFTRQFQYSFENETLLRALLSIPKQFDMEYIWTFDTTSRPWTLNLVTPEAGIGCEMRYARNMTEVRKSVDATELITRLYPLGYGEGVNQLTIKDVNSGVAYLDADTQSVWGIKQSIWSDARFEIAASLKARALAILEERKNPYISYKVKAADLYPLTGEPFDRFTPGKLVRVNDQEHGILVTARVTEITKKDVFGAPGDIAVTISNRTKTAADTIADLASRTSINELYAQGSTCVYQTSYADNADKDHPASMSLEIPTECVRINKLRLKMTLLPFRSYSQGAAAGGGTSVSSSSGGESTETTSSGGGSERTSSAGGSTQVTVEQRVSSTNLAVGSPLASGDGSSMYNTGASDIITSSAASGNTTGCMANGTYISTTGSNGAHTHSIASHSHTVAAHSHGMGHFHSGPSHTHPIAAHSHTGPSHSHGLAGHAHSFSGSDTAANGHTHTVKVTALNTSATTSGVSTNTQHTITISGTTSGNSGSTGSAGTGNTGSTSLTTDAAGTGYTGNAVTSAGSSRVYTSEAGDGDTGSTELTTGSNGDHVHSMGHSHGLNDHTHTVGAHTHFMRHFHTGAVTITIPSQEISIPSHRHTVTIDDHSHTVTIPSHTHEVTLSDHTHNLIPGIYDGPSATTVAVVVDETTVPDSAFDGDEIDLTPYLSKDDNGKIVRGTWHTITITPAPCEGNDGGLTRIEASVFVMTFARSQGGGDY